MNDETGLILASGSPRRKELLARTGRAFRVIVSDADEIAPKDMAPTDVAMHNARAKALAVASGQSDCETVIGADTIVVLNGRIFGKPVDERDARRMLRELSGKTVQVTQALPRARGPVRNPLRDHPTFASESFPTRKSRRISPRESRSIKPEPTAYKARPAPSSTISRAIMTTWLGYLSRV